MADRDLILLNLGLHLFSFAADFLGLVSFLFHNSFIHHLNNVLSLVLTLSSHFLDFRLAFGYDLSDSCLSFLISSIKLFGYPLVFHKKKVIIFLNLRVFLFKLCYHKQVMVEVLLKLVKGIAGQNQFILMLLLHNFYIVSIIFS